MQVQPSDEERRKEITHVKNNGSLPLGSKLGGGAKTKINKAFGSVIHTRPSQKLDVDDGFSNRVQNKQLSRDGVPVNPSINSLRPPQNVSGHFNPQGTLQQQSPPSVQVQEDSKYMHDYQSNKPISPSFRKQGGPEDSAPLVQESPNFTNLDLNVKSPSPPLS